MKTVRGELACAARSRAPRSCAVTPPTGLGVTPGPGAAGAARATQAQARAASADWLPSVGAFAEASTVRDQFFPDYKADQAVVGVRARWTLFDGGRQGRIAEAKANAAAAQAADDGARREIEADRARPRATARWVTTITVSVLAVLAASEALHQPEGWRASGACGASRQFRRSVGCRVSRVATLPATPDTDTRGPEN